jgi:hypothetical protein
MLPRTLATIGESLMRQTGWNISILAGGPTPDNGGMIMTYLFVKLFSVYAFLLLTFILDPILEKIRMGTRSKNSWAKRSTMRVFLYPSRDFLTHVSVSKTI